MKLWWGAAAVVAATVALAGPASASGQPGQMEVCAKGDYASFVKFLDQGRFETIKVPSGQCYVFRGLGRSTVAERIEVRGVYPDRPNVSFWVAKGQFRASEGGVVITYGKASGDRSAFITPL